MSDPAPAAPQSPEERRFIGWLTLAAVLALGLIASNFWAALLWATILALIFRPVYLRLAASGRTGWASLATVTLVLLCLIIPALIIALLIASELSSIASSPIATDPKVLTAKADILLSSLPDWASRWLAGKGVSDAGDLGAYLVAQLQANIQGISQSALSLGQSLIGIVLTVLMTLYLLFFFLIQGSSMVRQFKAVVPLSGPTKRSLGERIATLVRSTVKGTALVALLQGTIGGIIFAVLGLPSPLIWGTVMAFATLLPVIGTGLVWLPTALYLLATGQTWQGVALIFCGVFIIGGADNLARPMIVGRDTGLPDWVVLISTLGGVGLFGFHGVVLGPVVAGVTVALLELYRNSHGLPDGDPA
jgi:predicted PurR-regulated permease PerM